MDVEHLYTYGYLCVYEFSCICKRVKRPMWRVHRQTVSLKYIHRRDNMGDVNIQR